MHSNDVLTPSINTQSTYTPLEFQQQRNTTANAHSNRPTSSCTSIAERHGNRIRAVCIGIICIAIVSIFTFFRIRANNNNNTESADDNGATALGIKPRFNILCIGDSITEGGQYHDSFVRMLPTLFATRSNLFVSAANKGVSGHTMVRDGRCFDASAPPGNCAYIRTQDWTEVLAALRDANSTDTSIVTIMLGTNDSTQFNWSPSEYVNAYIAMLEDLANASQPPPLVFLLTPPPLYSPTVFGDVRIVNDSLNNITANENVGLVSQIFREAHQRGLATGLIDVYTHFTNSNFTRDITLDGCHPTHFGQSAIADIVTASIIDMIHALKKIC